MDKLLDVSHLVVEVKEVGPGVLVDTVRLALIKLLVDSCPYILKHRVSSNVYQPPHGVVTTHLEFFAASLMIFELTLEVGKPLAVLVQHIVQLAVLDEVLVEVCLVPHPLLVGHDARVSPAMVTSIIGAASFAHLIDIMDKSPGQRNAPQ